MTEAQWEQIAFFHKDENWGDWKMMDFDFIRTCDAFRHYIGDPMLVSCGIQGVHAQLSLHYSGLAADFVFPHRHKSLLDLFIDATRFPFSEIGIYPDWQYGGKKVGGIHLGKSKDVVLRKKYWVALDGAKGKAYLPANVESLEEAGVI